MKKGCFLKFIIIFTIVVAVVLYIIQNKFDDIFLKPGKELAISLVEDNWQNDLKFVDDNQEKDSLKSLLNYYINEIKSAEDIEKSSIEYLMDVLTASIEDSLINKEEITNITKIISDALRNE
ncbi:hypothetical protein ACFLSS_01885 [Bacteroidota bacterium]